MSMPDRHGREAATLWTLGESTAVRSTKVST